MSQRWNTPYINTFFKLRSIKKQMPLSKAISSLWLTVVLFFDSISFLFSGEEKIILIWNPLRVCLSPWVPFLGSQSFFVLTIGQFFVNTFWNWIHWFFQQVDLLCTISLINSGYHVALGLQVVYLCKSFDFLNLPFLISEGSRTWSVIIQVRLVSSHFYVGHFLFKVSAIQDFSPKIFHQNNDHKCWNIYYFAGIK